VTTATFRLTPHLSAV